MEFISLSTLIPCVSLPLTVLVRQILFQRTYGCLAYLNDQSAKGNVTYSEELPPVSVIITTHNQAYQLEQNLPVILEQDYPNFEVIVVNDCSEDNTDDVLKEMSFRYKNFYHTFTLPSARYISRKKLAITLGLKASHNEWIILTEADCTPQSDQWLRLMARNFSDSTRIVLGYANYAKESGFFNRRITFDRLIENCHFLSRVIYNDKAYRGDGCNLAFRKSVFMEQDGFAKNLQLARGEDSLLVNEMARPSQTRVECDPKAVMKQDPPFRRKTWTTDKVFFKETCKNFNSTGKWALRFFRLHTFINYLAYLQSALFLTLGILKLNYLLIVLSACCLIALTVGSILPLYRSSKSVNDRTFIFSLWWYELTRPIQNFYLYMRHEMTRKDKFLRK